MVIIYYIRYISYVYIYLRFYANKLQPDPCYTTCTLFLSIIEKYCYIYRYLASAVLCLVHFVCICKE